MKFSKESGLIHPLVVATIVLGILTAGLGGLSIWAFINYQDQKNNVDAKIALAVASAKTDQTKADQASFAEQEKLPARQIVGPVDLGQVTLSYPKTWSVYVDHDGIANSYEAYFYPGAVPPLASNTPYALRTSIINTTYETILGTFSDRIKSGKLVATSITVSGVDGTRLDGTFDTNIKGAMVLFKIRDKTLEVYTQSTNYITDFNGTVLASLQFNK